MTHYFVFIYCCRSKTVLTGFSSVTTHLNTYLSGFTDLHTFLTAPHLSSAYVIGLKVTVTPLASNAIDGNLTQYLTFMFKLNMLDTTSKVSSTSHMSDFRYGANVCKMTFKRVGSNDNFDLYLVLYQHATTNTANVNYRWIYRRSYHFISSVSATCNILSL